MAFGRVPVALCLDLRAAGPEFSPDVVYRINIVLTAGLLREKVR